MTLPVVWLAEAATELQDAVRWYTDINPQLGLRFAHAVENTVEAMSETPLLFVIVGKGRKRAGIHRFPYSLYFLLEEARIVVIACFHGKRDPPMAAAQPLRSSSECAILP